MDSKPKTVSRRGFLSATVGGGLASGVSSDTKTAQVPQQLFAILEQQWEYNDECFVSQDEVLHSGLFEAVNDAHVECQRLNERFYATESPAEFQYELETYLGDCDYDPQTVTWQQLLAAGMPAPYRVQALQTQPRKAPS